MAVTELIDASSMGQVYLHLALSEAAGAYKKSWEAMEEQLRLTEDTVTVELTRLRYEVMQRRAVVLVLTACCVEALGNLCLASIADPDQFNDLEGLNLFEKWATGPSKFFKEYSLPPGNLLGQDLKRLQKQRNALVHLKEDVSRLGAKISVSGRPPRADDDHKFIARCHTLPENLLSHLCTFADPVKMGAAHSVLTLAKGFSSNQRALGQ